MGACACARGMRMCCRILRPCSLQKTSQFVRDRLASRASRPDSALPTMVCVLSGAAPPRARKRVSVFSGLRGARGRVTSV
eukprot:6032205-Prymnesium_polylepis.2